MNALNPAAFDLAAQAHKPQPAVLRIPAAPKAVPASSGVDGVVAVCVGNGVALLAWAAFSAVVPSPLPTILTLCGAGAFLIGKSLVDLALWR